MRDIVTRCDEGRVTATGESRVESADSRASERRNKPRVAVEGYFTQPGPGEICAHSPNQKPPRTASPGGSQSGARHW